MTLGVGRPRHPAIRTRHVGHQPALTRHPRRHRRGAATVDDLAPGRVYIGIGAGGTGVWHSALGTATLDRARGVRPRCPLAARAGARAWPATPSRCSGRVRGGSRSSMSAHASSARSGSPGGSPTASSIGLGVSPEVVAGSLELLEAGAREAGRVIDDIEVWFTCFWWVDESPGARAPRAPGRRRRSPFTSPTRASRTSSCPTSSKARCSRSGGAYDLRSHGHPTTSRRPPTSSSPTASASASTCARRFMFAGTPGRGGGADPRGDGGRRDATSTARSTPTCPSTRADHEVGATRPAALRGRAG